MVALLNHPTADDHVSDAMRRCLASGLVKDKDVLLRFVVGPRNDVVPDVDERLPGRGFWLSADREFLKKACTKNLFAKAARSSVIVPDDLCDRVEALLVRRCLHLIGLARRAGEVVFGYEKVRARLRSGRSGLVFVASDASPGARERMRGLTSGSTVVDVLRASELALTDGRNRIVHLMVEPGALTVRLKRETGRLSGFRRSVSIGPEEMKTKGSMKRDG